MSWFSLAGSAYVAFAVGRQPVSFEHLAATLTRLWANALGLTENPGPRAPG